MTKKSRETYGFPYDPFPFFFVCFSFFFVCFSFFFVCFSFFFVCFSFFLYVFPSFCMFFLLFLCFSFFFCVFPSFFVFFFFFISLQLPSLQWLFLISSEQHSANPRESSYTAYTCFPRYLIHASTFVLKLSVSEPPAP